MLKIQAGPGLQETNLKGTPFSSWRVGDNGLEVFWARRENSISRAGPVVGPELSFLTRASR